jgi:hypothetical protein
MKSVALLLALGGIGIAFGPSVLPVDAAQAPAQASTAAAARSTERTSPQDYARARLEADLAAVQTHRPAYPFWQHIFVVPDGRIVYGSATDGRLLATFPVRGDWMRQGTWQDPALAKTLTRARLSARLTDRRDQVARLLEPATGPVMHNPSRGLFLTPNAEKYGSFLSEWGSIYERFAVPAEIGLAQAIVESGLNGRARSPARAVGFCQWLQRNWNHLDRLAPHVLEAYNQTTQAPYCAAYLTILATMYNSFIPALSEHHAGGVNVGRTVINGARLGGTNPRDQYLRGAQFARDLREISLRRYRDLFRTYGPRSFLYAEMVFGNTHNVSRLMSEMPQTLIFAMRTTRSIPLSEVVRTTKLSAEEIKRFNPAMVSGIPARADLYLPRYVPEFGADVSFWRRPASPAYLSVLNEFVRLEESVERWHEASFELVLRRFQDRFEETGTEEGAVMATMLAYVIDDLRTSRRSAILDEFRTSGRILRLFQQGVEELAATILN